MCQKNSIAAFSLFYGFSVEIASQQFLFIHMCLSIFNNFQLPYSFQKICRSNAADRSFIFI